MNLSSFSSVKPAEIAGIRRAINICDEFASENRRIAFDDIRRVCGKPGPTEIEDLDYSNMHGAKWQAAQEIAGHLRYLIGEGDAA